MKDVIEFWESPSDGRWYWHKRAGNGQITLGPGEGFASSQGCRRSAKREHPGTPLVLEHRVNAWVVGQHEMPEDVPFPVVEGDRGRVVVQGRTGPNVALGTWTLWEPEQFTEAFVWV